ncbi:MAG: hypothetical protein ABIK96_05560 [bacterium]
MGVTFGIRREDKNEWERRVPLIPDDLAALRSAHDLDFVVQPSPIRVFGDDEFARAGAVVSEDLAPAKVVLAVKEIPLDLLREKTAYLFFSHTVKGQAHNMPLLQRMLDLGCTLIDYEKIADEQNRRLIFFSVHAGFAGMIESLVAFGRRLEHEGLKTPLLEIRQAFRYADLGEAKEHLKAVGEKIAREGMGDHRRPVIIGLAGYGNVSRGCQEILDCLPARQIEPEDLEAAAGASVDEAGPLLKVVFHEEDMVEPRSKDAQFVLQDYYQRPGNYRGIFDRHLPRLDILVNTIYWEDRYPRLLTRKWAKAHYGPGKECRLKVVGDISCDIEGSCELTVKATMPDAPCYVVEPDSMEVVPGVAGEGPVIMAVDNLPCELPRESSEHFSRVLRDMVPELAQADFGVDFEGLHLPMYLKKAVIAHRGELAPGYRYLKDHLARSGK